MNGTTRRIRIGIATVSVLFCMAATAGPAMGQFGSCHIQGASGSKAGKAEKKKGKKGKGKHKNGSGGKRR